MISRATRRCSRSTIWDAIVAVNVGEKQVVWEQDELRHWRDNEFVSGERDTSERDDIAGLYVVGIQVDVTGLDAACWLEAVDNGKRCGVSFVLGPGVVLSIAWVDEADYIDPDDEPDD